ncbi:uncharacterized protein LOC134826581 [Bolinopsis microptera]|uniref:uncharacterized protein LOC134826581 n=1 Tax=Bolinopsis microptera TaxID=2820187 RepID=UPI0030790944
MDYNNHTIASILKESNLSQYKDKFIKHGADDPKQLALMSQSHFLQLMQHVGMSSKPFHVTRLLNALHSVLGISPDYDMPPVPEKSKLVYQGQPEFVTSVNKDVFETVPKRRKTKPFYGEVKLPSNEIFTDLTDVRTEEETNDMITQLSAIYRVNKPNKYQQYINACAAELAIRDPTLLARRSDLVTKAREANIRGGQYKFRKGFSISKSAPEEINAENNSKSNFALANKHREMRITEIQKLENTINSCMFEKEGLFERLKSETDKDNTAAIGFVRSKLDSLEEQLYVSKKRLSKLKNSQKRSEKYYTVKLSNLMSSDEIVKKQNKDKTSAPTDTDSNNFEAPKGPIKITNSKKSSSNHSRPESSYPSLSLDDLDVDELDSVTVTRDFASVPTYGLDTQTTAPQSHNYTVSSQNTGDQSHVFVVSNQNTISQSHDYANRNTISQSREFDLSNQNPTPCVMEQDILTDVFTNTINSNLSSQEEDPGFDIPNYHAAMHSN